MSTTNTPSVPDFATELAAAKVAALRSLVETLNTTDDPVEKRRIATAILRIPDPDAAPHPARTRRAPAPIEPFAPGESPGLEPLLQAVVESDDDTTRSVISSPAIDLIAPFAHIRAVHHTPVRPPTYTAAAGP